MVPPSSTRRPSGPMTRMEPKSISTGSPKCRTTRDGATRSTEDWFGWVDSSWACALAGPARTTVATTPSPAPQRTRRKSRGGAPPRRRRPGRPGNPAMVLLPPGSPAGGGVIIGARIGPDRSWSPRVLTASLVQVGRRPPRSLSAPRRPARRPVDYRFARATSSDGRPGRGAGHRGGRGGGGEPDRRGVVPVQALRRHHGNTADHHPHAAVAGLVHAERAQRRHRRLPL